MAGDEENGHENKRLWWQIFLVALAVFFVILLMKFLFKSENEKQKYKSVEEKKRRLEEVENEIKNLQQSREEIAKDEKRILFVSRILIGIVLILVNIIFLCTRIIAFKLGDILNLNEGILLFYTFVAYIFSGSVDKFVLKFKWGISDVLEEYHIKSIEKIELLIREKEILIEEIKNLSNSSE